MPIVERAAKPAQGGFSLAFGGAAALKRDFFHEWPVWAWLAHTALLHFRHYVDSTHRSNSLCKPGSLALASLILPGAPEGSQFRPGPAPAPSLARFTPN